MAGRILQTGNYNLQFSIARMPMRHAHLQMAPSQMQMGICILQTGNCDVNFSLARMQMIQAHLRMTMSHLQMAIDHVHMMIVDMQIAP